MLVLWTTALISVPIFFKRVPGNTLELMNHMHIVNHIFHNIGIPYENIGLFSSIIFNCILQIVRKVIPEKSWKNTWDEWISY